MGATASLLVEIAANTAKFVSGVDKANSTLKSFKTSIETIKFSALIQAAEIASQKIQALWGNVELGAKTLQIEDSFERIANSVGASSEALIKSLGEATQYVVDDSDMMLAASRALVAGLSPEQITELAKISVGASKMMATGVSEAFNQIIDSVTMLRTRGLKQARILVDDEEAFKAYGRSINKAASDLGELEKVQVLANAVIEKGGQVTKMAGKDLEAYSQLVQSLKSQWTEVKEFVGKVFVVILEGGVATFHMLSSGAYGLASNIVEAFSMIAAVGAHLPDFLGAEKFKEASKWLEALAKSLEDYRNAQKGISDKLFQNIWDLVTGKKPEAGGIFKPTDTAKTRDPMKEVAALEKFLQDKIKILEIERKIFDLQVLRETSERGIQDFLIEDEAHGMMILSLRERLLDVTLKKIAAELQSGKLTKDEADLQSKVAKELHEQEITLGRIQELDRAFNNLMRTQLDMGESLKGTYQEILALLDKMAEKEREAGSMEGVSPIFPVARMGVREEWDLQIKSLENQIALQKELNSIKMGRGMVSPLEAGRYELDAEKQITEQRIKQQQAIREITKDEDKIRTIDNEIFMLQQNLTALAEKRKLIMEELEARDKMDVGALIRIGGQKEAVRLNEQIANQYENILPGAIDVFLQSVNKLKEGWKGFFQSMIQGFQKLLQDIGMAIIKAQILAALPKSIGGGGGNLFGLFGKSGTPSAPSIGGGLEGVWEGGLPGSFGTLGMKGNSSVTVNNYNISAMDSQSFGEFAKRNKTAIVSQVYEDVRTNPRSPLRG